MNVFHIKIIAMVTMIIDHIGLYFFPESYLFRIIGRIAFPLFAWLIANGAYHTKNIKHYFIRLLLFACISQVPFALAYNTINPYAHPLNVFFTLSLGLLAIIGIKRTKRKLHWVLISLAAALTASLLGTDYGGFGVLSIIAFYLYFERKKALFVAQAWIYTMMSLYFFIQKNTLSSIELVGLLAFIPIALYRGKEGPKLQYLFYLIYPVHLLVIYLILMLW